MFSAAAEVLAEDGVLETHVFSTLTSISRVSKGALKNALHFEAKARLEEHLRAEHPQLAAKTSYLHAGFYYENIHIPFLKPVKQDDGPVVFPWPLNADSRLTAVDPPKDLGIFVRTLLHAPHGTVLLGESDLMTVQQVVDLWADVTGTMAKLVTVQREEFEKNIDSAMPSFGKQIADAFQWVTDFGYSTGDFAGKRPGDLGIKKSELSTYRSYLESQDWSSVLEA